MVILDISMNLPELDTGNIGPKMSYLQRLVIRFYSIKKEIELLKLSLEKTSNLNYLRFIVMYCIEYEIVNLKKN